MQIINLNCRGALQTFANSRIVLMPRNVEEYLDFYGIERRDGKAILYKAVRGDDLHSSHDPSFTYSAGQTIAHDCDPDTSRDCSYGLHVSTLRWALDFGYGWDDLRIVECAVPIDKIIYPDGSNGKVRTSELTVLRIVPLEDCGATGKIIIKRIVAKEALKDA